MQRSRGSLYLNRQLVADPLDDLSAGSRSVRTLLRVFAHFAKVVIAFKTVIGGCCDHLQEVLTHPVQPHHSADGHTVNGELRDRSYGMTAG